MSFIHDLVAKFAAIRKRESTLETVLKEYHQLEVKLGLAKAALQYYANKQNWDAGLFSHEKETCPWERAAEALEEIASDDVGVVSSKSAWGSPKMEG